MTHNGPIEIYKDDELIAWCTDPYYALKILEVIENGVLRCGDVAIEVHKEDDNETTQPEEVNA